MILKNEKGQMAVFIALFFQVLFVFFAMAINVGLVVHDKINLQNAVDLAAYYGAMKQAEVLNQIAHINYQMRQNYKLLAFRYRVMGNIGNRFSPYYPFGVYPGDILPEGRHDFGDGLADPQRIPPSVCVGHWYWQEHRNLEGKTTFCEEPQAGIPNIRIASGGGGIIGEYRNLVTYTQRANRLFQLQCEEIGILNWLFAARILIHFRMDGVVRKNMIQRLANNLSSPDFRDLRNDPVEEGVRNTFEKNLSRAHQVQNFTYYNSMTQGECANVERWLPEIRINPIVFFLDMKGDVNRCERENVPNRPMEGVTRRSAFPTNNFPVGLTRPELAREYLAMASEMQPHWSSEPAESTGLHSSIGFEKNPWCMVYSGVQATTQVRKPFSPTGGPITLSARGFAQPFGGRIGPWYGKVWPRESPNSQAASRNDKVDQLLPTRTVAGSAVSANTMDELVNFSFYPGDSLGMNSSRNYSAMAPNLRQFLQSFGNPRAGATGEAPFAWSTYNHLGGRDGLQVHGDTLARQSQVIPSPIVNSAPQRPYEIAAAAPNAFDAFYYSIEPDYHALYFSNNATNGGALFQPNEAIYDIGSAKEPVHPGTRPEYNVKDQVAQANNGTYNPNFDHKLSNWSHLLTSWHQRAAIDYTMDPSRFGVCTVPVENNTFPSTGSCLVGGRTGYAVKNVSRDFLLSSDHALGGGPSGATGAILNPPPF